MKKRIVIVGGGLAGAAAAYYLTRAHDSQVTLFETDLRPGSRSSAKSACMFRQATTDREVTALLTESRRRLLSLEEEWHLPLRTESSGSLLLADLQLAEEILRASDAIVEVSKRKPWLRSAADRQTLFTATDFVIDAQRLLFSFLDRALKQGLDLRTAQSATGIEWNGGTVVGVQTETELLPAEIVINAAGARATDASWLGFEPPFRVEPRRRHLFLSRHDRRFIEPSPFTWDLVENCYVRPDEGRALLCACDESPHGYDEPRPDSEAESLLRQKLERSFPDLLDLPLERKWVGLRSFSPDHRFVTGFDPVRSGLYWLVALGGHGIAAATEIGHQTASAVTAGSSPSGSPFSPSRFTGAER